jgi:hypothetical protein
MIILVSCQVPSLAKEKRTHGVRTPEPIANVTTTLTPSSAAVQIGAGIAGAASRSGDRLLPLADCLKGIAPSATLGERLDQAERSCSNGLQRNWASHVLSGGGLKDQLLGSAAFASPACIRLVVATDRSPSSTNASIVDERGRTLATAQGSTTVAVPALGALCLPRNSTLSFTATSSADSGQIQAILLSSVRPQP